LNYTVNTNQGNSSQRINTESVGEIEEPAIIMMTSTSKDEGKASRYGF